MIQDIERVNDKLSFPQMRDPNQLLSPIELSDYLGVPESSLAQWRYLGKGPLFIRANRHIRYRWRDVDGWLNAQTKQSTK